MTDFHFFQGESFNGAVARWAADNGADRMIDVTRVAGVQHAHRANAASAGFGPIEAMAAEMGVDPGELLKRSTPLDGPDRGSRSRRALNGISVHSSLIETRVRRFAPGAIKQRPYHRALWDFRLLPVCTDQWEYLRQRCGGSDCPDVGWHHTLGVDLCEHCLRDLSDAPSVEVEQELREPLRNVAALVHHEPAQRAAALASLPSELAALGPSVVIDLITRLLPVVEPGMTSIPFSPAAAAGPRPLAWAVADAWKIAAGWPASFLQLAGARAGGRQKRHGDGNAGETSRFLKMKPVIGICTPVVDLAAEVRRMIEVSGPDAGKLAGETYTIKATSILLAKGTAEIAEYRRAGALETILVMDRGQLQPLFSKAEVDDLVAGIADRISFGGASIRLGISRHGVEQLVAARLLRLLEHPFFEARYGATQIAESSIDELEGRLTDTGTGSALACTVPLSAAMTSVGGRIKPWGAALCALVGSTWEGPDHAMPHRVAAGEAPLARRILVERSAGSLLRELESIPSVWTEASFASHMSKIDAEELLNTGSRQVTELLAGFATVRGSHLPSIPIDAALALAAKHISTSELAARRGVSPQSAYRAARAVGSIPVLGPAGFCRESAERHYFPALEDG